MSPRVPAKLPRAATLTSVPLLCLLAGCGSSGDGGAGSPGSPGSSTGPVLAVARASAVLATLVRAQRESLDVLLGSITSGSVDTSTLFATLPQPLALTATGSRTIDMATANDGLGNLLFPGCTGSITIAWTGAVTSSQPTGSGGVGDWTVTITAATPVIRIDGQAGVIVFIPQGTALTTAMSVSANRADAADWHLTADATSPASGAFSTTATVTALDGSAPATVVLGGTIAFSYTASEAGLNWSSGTDATNHDGYDWTATVSDDIGSHSVVLEVEPPTIAVTVDGANELPAPGTYHQPLPPVVTLLIDIADLPGWLQVVTGL